MKAFVLLALLATPAEACHRYSVWRFPWPQHCVIRAAQTKAPDPPPVQLDPSAPEADNDIPLPSLEGMDFPPDASGDWDRLKAIGLLRQLRGTN